jgi:hypothetical protein
MSVATEPLTGEAPKLLLDTNVYLNLADGLLTRAEAQLIKLAGHRSPPLLWACPIAFDELVCRIWPDDQEDFERHRSALRWMELLCGSEGMAEDQNWIICRGVFAKAKPCDGTLAAALVSARSKIIAAASFGGLSQPVRSTLDTLRADYLQRIGDWIARKTATGKVASVPSLPGQPAIEGWTAAADAVVSKSRKIASTISTDWGEFRTDEDQKRAQREQIALETAFLNMSRNPQPYNHASHPSDYNDYWLCTYCAADYTLVTTDGRLRSAIVAGGCSDPRIVSLDEGIALAESWLAGC